MNTIKERIGAYIEKEGINLEGKAVLVACSGGPDSMFLLDFMRTYSELKHMVLAVVTIDHRLRPESKEEVQLIRRYCLAHGLPLYVFEEDVSHIASHEKISLETAGRMVRYKRFYDVAQRENYDYIALGHHKNDQCETVLAHLIRGSGLTGMEAMKPLEGKLLRPLLDVTKDEIVAALDEEGIAFAWDQSNDEPLYQRNRLRLEVIPLLKSFNPQIEDALLRMSHLATIDNDYLEMQTEKAYEHLVKSFVSELYGEEEEATLVKVVLDRKGFQKLDKSIRYRLWRRVAKDFYPYGVTPSFKNVETMEELLFGKTNKEFSSKWMKILVEYDTIYFAQPTHKYEREEGLSFVPETKESPYMDKPPKGVFVIPRSYADKGLVIRRRQPGDVIIVCNKERQIKGHKKVKKYLIDKKVPQEDRGNMMWLVSGNVILCEASATKSFALYDPCEKEYVAGFLEEDQR